ncbi:MAG: trans-aconitate 2-methyltransferase [Vicinamibacterales bacterium]
MGVSRHLKINLSEYDAMIRTFVPGYERLLEVTAATLAGLRTRRPHLLELGIGTGALAARCLATSPRARLTGIDADRAILEQAGRRLAPHAARVTLVSGDFSRYELPRCHAVVASLALHHVRTIPSKTRLYRRVAHALEAGGLLINADAAIPDDPSLATLAMDAWRDHLRRTYTASQTRAYFHAWAGEDRYFTLAEELMMLRRAGLVPDVVWRSGVYAVVAARKSGPAMPGSTLRVGPLRGRKPPSRRHRRGNAGPARA